MLHKAKICLLLVLFELSFNYLWLIKIHMICAVELWDLKAFVQKVFMWNAVVGLLMFAVRGYRKSFIGL